MNVPATGGYQTWATVIATVTLPAGTQTLTVDQDNAGWNINFLAFGLNTSTGGGEAPYGGTAAAVPGTVQAENYDTGGQGVAYNVTSVNGSANGYRSDGVDLEATTDTGGGYDLGWTAAGQWFKYTVNVATAGTYTVGLRLAAPAAVTDGLHIDNSAGTNLSGNVNVPATGGYQDWATVNATVTLPAGTQTLTVDQDNGGWNINYLTFTATARRRGGPLRRDGGGGAGHRAGGELRHRRAGRGLQRHLDQRLAPTATAPTGWTWRPPRTPAAATTWAGPRPGSGSSTPSTSPPPAPTTSGCGWRRPPRSPTPCTSTTAPAPT